MTAKNGERKNMVVKIKRFVPLSSPPSFTLSNIWLSFFHFPILPRLNGGPSSSSSFVIFRCKKVPKLDRHISQKFFCFSAKGN